MQTPKEQIASLIELNDELENYFRNTIIPQLFVDADLILRKFTPPAMKQFNLATTDVGRPLSEIKENLRFPSISENIQHVITTGEILEKEIQTIDLRWFQMNILPYVQVKDNKTNGVIITFVEITMRIRDLKEQEKLIMEHELLLDTISHDIRTPLTSLALTIEMLKKLPGKSMERFPLLLVKIENSFQKMQSVIFDLTESRQSEHRYQAVEELIDIQNILEDVRLTLAPQIAEAHVRITTEIEVSEITFVRRNLRSIVYNLVNNSIKYRSPNREAFVKVHTYAEGNYTVISVEDNGIGLKEDDLGKIFKKYARATDAVEGTGVGLYLVNEIVKAAGGNLDVQSQFGNGTTIKVKIPNAVATASE